MDSLVVTMLRMTTLTLGWVAWNCLPAAVIQLSSWLLPLYWEVKTKVTLLAAPAVAAPIAVMPVVTPRAANNAAVFFLALGVENMCNLLFLRMKREARHTPGPTGRN